MKLSDRKKQILKAIVDDYIMTTEPVGSKNLIKRHDLQVSSATIRNEMMELEELGYLEKPHTSAGRIPSDKGYRTYVDEMLELTPLSQAERQLIDDYYRDHLQEVAELIKSSADLLSRQTAYPTLVLTPRYADTSLQQIKLLMIEPGKALIVVVLNPGIVKDRMIRIPQEIDAVSLSQLANSIEAGLSGKKLDEITLITMEAASTELSKSIPEPLLNQVLFETYISIKQAENVDVYMQGSHNLLKQPEFQDAVKAHRVMEQINHHALIAGYMSEMTDDCVHPNGDIYCQSPAYTVRIGQEIALDGFEDCSFVTTTYKVSDNIRGRIAVLGPRRMAYDRIISQISFINQKMTNEIRKIAQGEINE